MHRSRLLVVALFVSACGSLTAGSGEPPDGDGGTGTGGGPPPGVEAGASQGDGAQPLPPWESLIDRERLHQITITCPPGEETTKLELLHGGAALGEPDIDSACDLTFDDVSFKSVAVHQKGSDFSGCRCLHLAPGAMACANPKCTTRYPDKIKPGLKVKFDAVISSQRLYGLKRLVLNNAHQDLSFMSADVTYEIYRRAGLNAPHTAFAQVVINGYPQGLYNLEEDSDKQFLQRNFGSNSGNFYEGTGFDFVTIPDAQGVGDRANRGVFLDDEVADMRKRDDLYAISAAVLGTPDAMFYDEVKKLVDLDRFISFFAVDFLVAWHDTYVTNLNNYLLYDNPADGRIVFLPHGADCGLGVGPLEMDQNGKEVIGYYSPANIGAYPAPRGSLGNAADGEVVAGMLAMAVQDIPSVYTRYRDEVKRISGTTVMNGAPPVWDVNVLLGRVALLEKLLATAPQDARMKLDVEQFGKYKTRVRDFIKKAGTSKIPETKPKPSGVVPDAKRVPVIFASDLFYPPTPETVDAFFALAVLSSMPEVDLKGVVLGNAAKGRDRPQAESKTATPGAVNLGQMQTILRQRTPGFVGLNRKLAGINDQVTDDEPRFQHGVQFILDTLKSATEKITIVTDGSLRDVAAAFNRDRNLFSQKVGRLLVFGGEAATDAAGRANASDDVVTLDPFAFAAIMKSGLPLFWVPRSDGGKGVNLGKASSWAAPMGDTLGQLVDPMSPYSPILQYFVNGLGGNGGSPYAYLIVWQVDTTSRDALFAQTKDLSSGAVLAAIADKTVVYDGVQSLPTLAGGLSSASPPLDAMFGFSDVTVTVSDRGAVTYGAGAGSQTLKRFDRLKSPATYAKAMSLMTGKMLTRLMTVK